MGGGHAAGGEPGRAGDWTGAWTGPPGWVSASALVLAVAGFAASAYLTVAHYTATATVTLACPNTGTINCEKVTTSPQSQILGVPVATLGLVFFAGMAVLGTPAAWRSTRRWVRSTRLLGVVSGIGFVVYLVYTELFTLDALCLWCTCVHVLTFGLFVVTVLGTAGWNASGDR